MAGYTRQSSFTDGDIINAADSNDEFNQLVNVFSNTTGHKHDGTAAEGPVIGLIGDPGVATPINKVVVDDTNNRIGVFVDVSGTTTEQLRFQDGVIVPVTTNDVDIGSSSLKFKDLHLAGAANIAGTVTLSGNVLVSGTLGADLIPDGDNTRDIGSTSAEWKDLYIDGTAYVDAINYDGTAITATAAELNLMDGGTSAGTTAVAGGDGIVTNDAGTMRQTTVDTFDTYLSQTSKTLTNKTLTTPVIAEIDSGTDITLDATADINLDAGGGDVFLKDDGTTYGSLTNSSGNLIIKSGTTTALTFSGADATIAGDLTISGDDLTMGTNTAGHLLIADGTNFNPVAVSGDVTISSAGAVTIANNAVETAMVNANVITGQTAETSLDTSNDTVLIHDASASALRKTTLASISSALGGITDVVADTTPQLGGDLDINGNDIVSVSNGNIDILPNGTGVVNLDGDGSSGGVSISDGLIDIRTGTGNVSKVKFYCESSNAHAQTLQAQPHSAGSSAVLVLPTASGTLIGTGDSSTVTNGMLAGSIADSKLNTISTAGKVDIGALEIDGATDIGADLVDADLVIVDDGANGTERKSELTRVKKYIYSAMSGDATASDAGALTIANDAVESGMLNDNIISGQTELASGLADTDELLVSDAGTIKRMDLSVVKTYLTNAGFSSEDPTALAIALG